MVNCRTICSHNPKLIDRINRDGKIGDDTPLSLKWVIFPAPWLPVHDQFHQALVWPRSTPVGELKIKGVTMHTLRHSFASRLVLAGVNLRVVQELGGWQTIAMVERYSHLTPAHKAEAVEKLTEFHNAFHNTESGAFVWFANSLRTNAGGVTEWSNVPVLKTGVRATGPWVQIPPPPPLFNRLRATGAASASLTLSGVTENVTATSSFLRASPPASIILARDVAVNI